MALETFLDVGRPSPLICIFMNLGHYCVMEFFSSEIAAFSSGAGRDNFEFIHSLIEY